jgi:hypothetical protein
MEMEMAGDKILNLNLILNLPERVKGRAKILDRLKRISKNREWMIFTKGGFD